MHCKGKLPLISLRGIILALFFLSSNSLFAQLQVDNTLNAGQLAQLLVGNGVTIQNVQINCATDAYGSFDGTNSNLGIDQGVILTTGSIFDAIGPNLSDNTGFGNSGVGDPDLTATAGFPPLGTEDACILEFDVIPQGDTLRFNYSFGSEEYNEYVCSDFNDVFAFYVSGPGITGVQNIALVPGTTTPVAINSVNNGTVGLFGTAGSCVSLANQQYFTDNTLGQTIEYDGFTTNLVAEVVVIPCQTYHLKMGVADATDDIFDSGVFIEQLESPSIALSFQTQWPNVLYAIEGCNNAYVTFTSNFVVPQATTVYYTIGGTAVNGVDYTAIPDSIVIPAGNQSASLQIEALFDGVNEGTETVVLSLFNQCNGLVYDSIVVTISEFVDPVVATDDTTICRGSSVPLNVTGAATYVWSPANGLSDTAIANPLATPTVTTTYIVLGEILNCPPGTDTVVITVDSTPVVTAGPDFSLCFGNTAVLQGFTDANVFNWTPSTGLSDPNILNPVASPVATTIYTLTGSINNCTAFDQVTVSVTTTLNSDAGPDVTVCQGDSVQLSSIGGNTVLWSPSGSLSDPNVYNPFAFPQQTTTYTALFSSSNCSETDSVTVFVESTNVDAGNDTTVCNGLPTAIGTNPDPALNYTWSPSDNLSDTSIANPVFSYTLDGDVSVAFTYVVNTLSTNNCPATDTITITVRPDAAADAGEDKVIDIGESVMLNGSGGDTCYWMPFTSLSDPSICDPIAAPDQTIEYVLTVIDQYGCISTDTVVVIVGDAVLVPQAFSPNGDGANEQIFAIVLGGTELLEFRIYNRWGEEVFMTGDASIGWDGTHRGEPQDIGTYVYFVKAVTELGEEIVKQGNITLLR